MLRSSIALRALVASVVACAFLCLTTAGAGAAPLIWASNFGEDTVSTLDSATGQAVGTPIHVPAEPESIAITPNGRWAVVIGDANGTATVIETATRTPVKTVKFGTSVRTVAISPNGQRAYVALEAEEEIAAIDPETGEPIGSFPVPGKPLSLAVSPDGRELFVGLVEGGIAVVDTATDEVVGKPIPVGGVVTSVVFAPDGKTAYATGDPIDEVLVIDVALGEAVSSVPLPAGSKPHSLAASPDGRRVYVATKQPPALSIIETEEDRIVRFPASLPVSPNEIAVTPDGSTAMVAGGKVVPFNLPGGNTEPPLEVAGNDVQGLAIAPDQSPTAAFTAPAEVATGALVTFDGTPSSDPDGSVVSWEWFSGEGGGRSSGKSVSFAYAQPGTYDAKLRVTDNEGCGEAQVFTGRAALCSGNAGATVTHPVRVRTLPLAPTPPAPAATSPSNRVRFDRVVHNLRNGTVRVQVTLPDAGFVLLFGKKVHAVTRKSLGPQTMWLTLHARVELAKRLKKTLRATVKYRVTFTPDGGTPRTVYRSATLIRQPRHKH
jgi:DNA-binding beta-propeller fold protein YncE